MRCVSCKAKGSWFCEDCESEHETLQREVRKVARFLGEDESEGPLVLSALKLLRAYDLVESTALGKAQINAKARELLLEVEDHFRNTPMCPLCKEHKMELITGDPVRVTCTGGCSFDDD